MGSLEGSVDGRPRGVEFATTLDYRDDPRWVARARLVSPTLLREHSLVDEARELWRVLRGARRYDVMLLDSATGRFQPDLLATCLLGLLPRRRRPAIVMFGDLWEPDPGIAGALERFLLRLADRAVTRYAALSSDEIVVFPETWGVGAGKVAFTHYFWTLTERDLVAPPPPVGEYVFSGGNSHRDYDSLVEAARRMPGREFVVATSLLDGRRDLPANVTARAVPHAEFVALMRGAAAVVVPLRPGLRRSTGHQTYLNAMYLGKPTIVNDSLGVRDHVRDGETAVIVDGTPAGYARALEWVLAPENAASVSAMCAAAADDVRARLSFTAHVGELLAVVDDAAAARFPDAYSRAVSAAGADGRSVNGSIGG